MFGFSIQSSCTDGPILSLSAISCPIAFISRKTALGPPTLSSLDLFFLFSYFKATCPGRRNTCSEIRKQGKPLEMQFEFPVAVRIWLVSCMYHCLSFFSHFRKYVSVSYFLKPNLSILTLACPLES